MSQKKPTKPHKDGRESGLTPAELHLAEAFEAVLESDPELAAEFEALFEADEDLDVDKGDGMAPGAAEKLLIEWSEVA